MSLEVTLRCDGHGCSAERYLHQEFKREWPHIQSDGWVKDPDNDDYHYCPMCWQKIKSEQEN